MILDISFSKLFLGEEDAVFLFEVVIRTLIMFLVILIGLSLTGKRGVKQLSVFELVVIIGLGSAAGDPMFYKEVGILHAVVVFTTVIVLYKLTTILVAKSPVVEAFIEGKPLKVIEDGQFCLEQLGKNLMGDDEFFIELRLRNVTHLGQVKMAILETSGEMSIFYMADEQVKFGLPIIPDLFKHKQKEITHEAVYSCAFCGNTERISPVAIKICGVCDRKKWVLSINEKRIT